MTKESLLMQYQSECRNALESVVNISKSFQKVFMDAMKLFMAITALSFKTTSIILVILRKTIIFAHSDAGSTASGVSFYRSYKIIFVGVDEEGKPTKHGKTKIEFVSDRLKSIE